MIPATDNAESQGDLGRQPFSLARAAGIISIGNIASRTVGLAREFVKADLFGATGLVSAFEVANIVPTMMYDLLVGGMISSALVPVLSDYAQPDRDRGDFWQLVSTMVSLAGLVLTGIVIIAELVAPQIAWLFGAQQFDNPELWPVATNLLRTMLPAVLFLNISGLVTGALYSLRRFSLPAFTGAIFNASVVMAAVLKPGDIKGLAWGVLAGSVLQVILQLPALDLSRLRWRWDAHHPALRRVLALYIPIVIGVVVSQLAIAFSYNLATITGDANIATMRYATTLIQFPLGLVATAISVAILPTLSQQSGELGTFKSTLAQGLRLLTILIVPATAGLFVLANPIVGLAFEHGDFVAEATAETATVLRFYLIGLPFAAVDQLLIFASYARKNSLAPAAVGVLSVFVYLAVAIGLHRPVGFHGLMIADSVKHMFHAGVMAWILRRRLGKIRDHVVSTALKATLAATIMGIVVWLICQGWPAGLLGSSVALERVGKVCIGGAAGVLTYAALLKLFGSTEYNILARVLRHRLGSIRRP